MDKHQQSLNAFRNNSQNAKFFNNGNENININGDNNTITKIEHHHHKPAKIKNEFTPNYNIHISSEQANSLQTMINDIVDKEVIGGLSRQKAFAKWHKQLKNYMKVNSYLAIEKEDFELAAAYLRKQNVLKRSKTRRKNNDYWRKDIYKAIYQRTNQLNLSKQDLYKIVHERYGKNIDSITELGERNLDDLRKYIFNLKG